jgi:hypothetical protein
MAQPTAEQAAVLRRIYVLARAQEDLTKEILNDVDFVQDARELLSDAIRKKNAFE